MRPPRLRPGDAVGIVAMSGVATQAQLDRGIANMQSLGLVPRPGRNVLAARGGYAGTVEQRVDDLHAMFRDESVRAIWAARGGSSAATLLPHLDYRLIRAHPKALVGYSDVTAIHLALLRHAGLVSFHGPVSSSTFSAYNAAHLRAVLMEGAVGIRMPLREREPDPFPPEEGAARVFRSGTAEGPLVGGNLSTLAALIGTPHMPDLRGCVLFLEDVGEAPYRIDRMLTQLEQAGVFAQAAGVALGIFRKCSPPDDEPSLSLREVFADRLGSLRIPCAYGFAIGHIAQQLTLPLGVRARMDADARTLTLLESPVASA